MLNKEISFLERLGNKRLSSHYYNMANMKSDSKSKNSTGNFFIDFQRFDFILMQLLNRIIFTIL
jgi:hypothetical protein